MHYNFDEVIHRENTNSVKFDLRRQVFRNEQVIPMWVADMDFRTPDFIISAVRKRLEHEILGYSIVPDSYYDSIVKWNKRRHNWNIKPGWISFAPGVVPALSLLVMAFTQPGEEIIIQPPVYFPFFSVIKSHGRKLITSPLKYENGRYRMDPQDIISQITPDTRMLFLCNPHNPVGKVWTPETLKTLSGICIKNNILVISDEIHSDLILPGFRHTPTAKLSEEIASNTITCMAPSKTFNLAGLSTAFLVISNSRLKAQYDQILDRVHVGAGNIFGYTAAEAAYTYGDQWLDQLMNYLAGNLKFLNEFISLKIPQIKVIPAEATYLIWLDCSGLGMNSEQLKTFMINEAGLGMNDGPQFGSEGTGFQRINIGCPRETLHRALIKLHAAVARFFEK